LDWEKLTFFWHIGTVKSYDKSNKKYKGLDQAPPPSNKAIGLPLQNYFCKLLLSQSASLIKTEHICVLM